MCLVFEWDSKKAAINIAKQSVSFAEATTIFGDKFSITIPDPKHSQKEARFVTIGKTISAQVIVVVHTERGDKIRIISARQASRKERKTYEEIYEQES
jgi:uncharacterized DUF497 family protein